MGKLAIISEETVRKIVTRQLAFDAVRAAFEAVAVDRSRVFDVVIGSGLHNREAFATKSGIDGENERVGFKCGTYWAGNLDEGLEFQHAYNDGLLNSVDDIRALGLVTLLKSPGRISDTQVTVFDSSGIAIQDLAVAGAIFEAAQQMSQVHYIDF